MISLALVNGIPQWAVIKWFITCLTLVHPFTWLELYQSGLGWRPWASVRHPPLLFASPSCDGDYLSTIMIYIYFHINPLFIGSWLCFFYTAIPLCILSWLRSDWVMEVRIYIISLVAIHLVSVFMDMQCIGQWPCFELVYTKHGYA